MVLPRPLKALVVISPVFFDITGVTQLQLYISVNWQLSPQHLEPLYSVGGKGKGPKIARTISKSK